ncbi:MAG TPA: tetratricopeptide repeat protein [Candidatus Angelobacter sp.]|jgi:tetratricopeptide (TPR) repeat protein
MNNMTKNALLALVLGLSTRGYGQSACAQLGVNCSHPNIQQTQPSSRPTPHYQPPPDNSDHASSATDAGYAAYRRYWSSGSQADFSEAYQQFQNAFANIPQYGPAELGLCQLYERSGDYVKAIAACQIATESHRFAHGRDVKKWLLKEKIPFLTIDLHQEIYKGIVAEYDRKCGGGETANQFNSGIVAAESEQGLTVDLRANTSQTVADCSKAAGDIVLRASTLNNEIDAWNARHTGGK